jgi:hypothetical protein
MKIMRFLDPLLMKSFDYQLLKEISPHFSAGAEKFVEMTFAVGDTGFKGGGAKRLPF